MILGQILCFDICKIGSNCHYQVQMKSEKSLCAVSRTEMTPHATLKLNAEPSFCMEEGLLIVKNKGRELFVEQHQEVSVPDLLLWIILRSERPIPVFTLESFHPPPHYWHLLWYLLISFLPFLCSPTYTVGQPFPQTQAPFFCWPGLSWNTSALVLSRRKLDDEPKMKSAWRKLTAFIGKVSAAFGSPNSNKTGHKAIFS